MSIHRGSTRHGRLGRRTAVGQSASPRAQPRWEPHPGAAQAPDAQTTNIPYTAWAGTQLRLVKCDDELIGVRDSGLDVVVESWSGDPNLRPTAFESSVTKLGGIDGRCARANVVSLGDGLARIKLKAFEGARATEVLEHQFLAIWLRLGTPAIDEVGATDPTAGPSRLGVGGR